MLMTTSLPTRQLYSLLQSAENEVIWSADARIRVMSQESASSDSWNVAPARGQPRESFSVVNTVLAKSVRSPTSPFEATQ